MQTFVWGKEFYTGIDAVDAQHHGLVDLFNSLAETLVVGGQDGENEAVVHLAFSQLMDYTKEHFSTEEALMQRAGIDARHLAMHQRLHRDFADQVFAMWSARASLSNPAEVFLSFLTSWLCLHVLGVDQLMARQLAAIGQGFTPAAALAQEENRPRDNTAEAMIKALRNTYHVVSKLSLDLIAANRQLEERVAARTRELQHANDALLRANRQLEVFSQTDGLLGIANRKYFESRLHEEWLRAGRDQISLGLLMIDVDFFKRYNDRYGHQAGDRCLQRVAQSAASRLTRAGDLFARYGGEEFIALLPNTSAQGAYKVGLELCALISSLDIAHDASSVAPQVTISVGATAVTPLRDGLAADAVAAADQALYAAKQQGRNRVCLA